MPTIRVESLRHISRLEFEIPGPGVHLLCGKNGCGKSTLLACLLRLGHPTAFSNHFRTSTVSRQLDQHEGTRITYELSGREVSYSYGGKRWAPTPKRNADILDGMGYPSVLHVGATASRIEPRPEDFAPQRVRDAPESIRQAAEQILGDQKFRELKRINVKRGAGAEAYLLPDAKLIERNKNQRNYYFSEKNFSLGELCVLKLLRDLEKSGSRTLVLIDELELALHPSAQVNLFRHLERIATAKDLTVIFSTHSTSVIKAARQNQILLLESVDGTTRCVRGAFPAQAIGTLALPLDATLDRAIFVEDDQARDIVDSLVKRVVASRFRDQAFPTWVVIPVGAFSSLLTFLETAPAYLGNSTRVFGLMDGDVRDENLADMTRRGDHAGLARFAAVENLRFLPWTPEVGIARRLERNRGASEQGLRLFLGDNRFSLAAVEWGTFTGATGAAQRRAAKAVISDLVNQISRIRAVDTRGARRLISDYFAQEEMNDVLTANNHLAFFMPLLR